MVNAEARRRDLYNGLQELLGTERADTLMAHLPLREMTELATKGDIARLEARFDGLETRFDGLEARFDGSEARFDSLEARFDGLEARFGGLEARVDRLDGKLDAGLASVNQRLDRFFLTQSAGLIAMVGTLITALLL